MDEDWASCGMCGVDPIEHENVIIGLTVMNLCEECYQVYISTMKVNRHSLSGDAEGLPNVSNPCNWCLDTAWLIW